jgi:hypothetical protein
MISDTRTLASKWIIEHIPKGSIIAAEGIREGAYMPPVSETEYKLIKVDLLADHPLDYYLENKADYLIASSLCYYRYTEEATPERFLFYRNLFKDYKTIKEFRSPFGQYAFHNPIIKIIRLSQDKNDSL